MNAEVPPPVARVRAARASDEPMLREYFAGLSDHSRRMRFHRWLGALDEAQVRAFAAPDGLHHMAYVCEIATASGTAIVGEARCFANPSRRSCEFGVSVADAWHGTGIAEALMGALVQWARERGFRRMQGLVLRENAAMLRFSARLGFVAEPIPEDPAEVRVVKTL